MLDEATMRAAFDWPHLAAAFGTLGVRWAIGGSLASAAHGEPRATNDVDVIALLER